MKKKLKETAGISVSLSELIALRGTRDKALLPNKTLGSHSGLYQSKLRGRGIDFEEVRAYQAGDDIRHMEWRVTARTDRPQIKTYREERERPVYMVVDFNPSMFFATKKAFKSVVAARLAAMLAWSCVSHNDRVGGMVFSGDYHYEIKPRGRKLGVLPLLKIIVRLILIFFIKTML